MDIVILEAVRQHERSRARADDAALEHSLERHARTVDAVRRALHGAGHTVRSMPVLPGLLARLGTLECDLVFNTYFGPGRRQDQAGIAGLLELSGRPATSGDATCHYVGLSKPMTKHLLRSCGIPTPGFVTCRSGEADAARVVEEQELAWPLIVKPCAEGEGLGIDEHSVVETPAELAGQLTRMGEVYGEVCLVEEYVGGRELTVGVLDGREPRVLPVLELGLGRHRVYSHEVKARALATETCPAALEPRVCERVGELAVRAGRAMGCRDYWRVDFRLDDRDRPQVLEVNTLPGMQPGYSDFPRMADSAGLGYDAIVAAILESAARRHARPGTP